MPFDGRNFTETKPDISLVDLAAWLRTQDLDTEYNYCSITDCLMVRYMRARGLQVDHASPYVAYLVNGRVLSIPQDLNSIANDIRCTYSEALRRAEYKLYGPWYMRLFRAALARARTP